MESVMKYLFYIILGYLSGSVMYAYLIPRLLKHIDIRELSEDGNPGTANAFLHAGVPIGILVILCELLKVRFPYGRRRAACPYRTCSLHRFWRHPFWAMPFLSFSAEKAAGNPLPYPLACLSDCIPT